MNRTTAQGLDLRHASLWLLALLAFFTGCASDFSAYERDPYDPASTEALLRRYSQRTQARSEQLRPSLEVSVKDMELALAGHASRREREAELLAEHSGAIAFRGADLPLEDLARRVRGHYARGQRDLATSWIDAHPRLKTWAEADELVSHKATFVRDRAGEGVLEVTLRRRPGVEGALAVAFPPGTFAAALSADSRALPFVPELPQTDLLAYLTDRRPPSGRGDWTKPESERRWGHWPRAQDLALLRAPVVVLAATQHATRVRVPVACADFDVLAPEHGRAYRLASFEAGSPVDRLAVELCARRPDSREAQLALWLAREDLEWGTFTRREGHRGQIATFQGNESVLPRHALGASRLLLRAGVDPRPLRFFLPKLEALPESPPEPQELPPRLEEPEARGEPLVSAEG